MLNDKKLQLMSVIVLLAGCCIAWAADPNDNTVRLSFEISPMSLGPCGGNYLSAWPPAWRRVGEYKPRYAAGVTSEGSGGRFFARTGDLSVGQFLRFALDHGGFSAAQRNFLEATRGLLDVHRDSGPVPQWYRPPNEPNAPRQLLLYAVTLEDARKMAQAYYQYARNGFDRQIDTLERLIEGTTGKIVEAERRMLQLDELIQASHKSLEDLQKTVPYRTEAEAHEAVGELDRMLNTAQVEIAGIKARVAAIQGYQQQERAGVPAVLSRLSMMFIEEAIALRGAEAREQMATHLREQANRFLDLKSTLANAAIEKEKITESRNGNQVNLAVMKDQLKSAREDEPEIPKEVVIYPVKWVDMDEPMGN